MNILDSPTYAGWTWGGVLLNTTISVMDLTWPPPWAELETFWTVLVACTRPPYDGWRAWHLCAYNWHVFCTVPEKALAGGVVLSFRLIFFLSFSLIIICCNGLQSTCMSNLYYWPFFTYYIYIYTRTGMSSQIILYLFTHHYHIVHNTLYTSNLL